MFPLYTLVVRCYGLIIRIAALKNLKARQWVSGRENWRKQLSDKILKLNSDKIVWVHCASYGEFEQGRPLIEAIKAKHSDYNIVLSFFSPSGYEAFKNWSGAEVICYLPLDTKRHAKDFLNIVKPKTAIFIKYEFWLNYLFQLKKQNISAFLVSAVFKPHHPFFKWYGNIFKTSLQTFEKLFIQDEQSGKLLQSIGISNYEVSGDTRFDRVLQIKNNFKPIDFFETFCKNSPVIVGGSTWAKDNELLIETFKHLSEKNLKLILVPHNVDEKSIHETEKLLQKNNLNYSLYSKNFVDENAQILVVNTMGLLSRIYHYATVTYVGGGFNSGIHNCLEPAVHLKPVLFHGGNDYHKYNEAVELLELHAAQNIENANEATKYISNYLQNPNQLKDIENKLQEYFSKNSGTTDKVMSLIKW